MLVNITIIHIIRSLYMVLFKTYIFTHVLHFWVYICIYNKFQIQIKKKSMSQCWAIVSQMVNCCYNTHLANLKYIASRCYCVYIYKYNKSQIRIKKKKEMSSF